MTASKLIITTSNFAKALFHQYWSISIDLFTEMPLLKLTIMHAIEELWDNEDSEAKKSRWHGTRLAILAYKDEY